MDIDAGIAGVFHHTPVLGECFLIHYKSKGVSLIDCGFWPVVITLKKETA